MPVALVGATIYTSPTEEPIEDGIVVIDNGKIAAVGSRTSVDLPQSGQLLNCSGFTITAGFWNSHVHFFERKWANAAEIPASELTRQLQDMLTRYGFTSVFDLGSEWKNTRHIRDRIESGEVRGPRIRSTGEGLIPPGAIPSETVLHMMGAMNVPLPEVKNAREAANAARKLLDQGVDGIKLFASSPRSAALPQSVIEAAAREAHRVGKPVFVHPNNGVDVLTAVRAGADIVAHTTPQSGDWDETILSEMKAHRVALTPTLTIWKYYARHDRVSMQEQIVRAETGQLEAWASMGGAVLFGTDLGAVDPDPTEEYMLMMQSAMNFRQILASLTTAPAERFGQSERLGRIATGLHADLVVLRGDPAGNIRLMAAVEYTLRDGRIIYHSGLRV
jgi:imidazolonepropionase-like amidohydrolase